ncbi:MAG: 5-(carboxyamino)imidazole ribonucleotide synthase [Gammaproteobacteria bacterium]
MRIGILGAGQLGRMMALAGYPLGLRFTFLDRAADTPGGQLADIIVSEFDDGDALRRLARQSDRLTFDWENVPVGPLEALAAEARILPPLQALGTAQDRLAEKSLFRDLDIATNDFAAVDDAAELAEAAQRLGYPCVLKTRRLGYDGKGQRILRGAGDLGAAWADLGDAPCLLEQFIPFEFEVSLVAVRSTDGETAFYPLSRNVHQDGILRYSVAPWEAPELEAQARRALERLFTHFDYAGVLTVEFFARDGQLLANEMAPRVHNSGHWTIEGAVTCQFENHLRAILGLPLGSTRARGHSAMVNFLGAMPAAADILAVPGAHLHDYGKEPRPGRKLGHGTIVAETTAQRDRGMERLRALAENA